MGMGQNREYQIFFYGYIPSSSYSRGSPLIHTLYSYRYDVKIMIGIHTRYRLSMSSANANPYLKMCDYGNHERA